MGEIRPGFGSLGLLKIRTGGQTPAQKLVANPAANQCIGH